MKNVNNIDGQKFNKLTAIEYAGNEKYKFQCDCGASVVKKTSDVKRGKIKSCSRKCTTGNPSKHPLYHTWTGIKNRCYHENATGYSRYGGLGITMCDSWKNSFWNFVEDMGERPYSSATVDRIDNTLGYSKENCRWASKKEQASNTKRSLHVTYKGKQYTVKGICDKLGLNYDRAYYVIRRDKITPDEYFNF